MGFAVRFGDDLLQAGESITELGDIEMVEDMKFALRVRDGAWIVKVMDTYPRPISDAEAFDTDEELMRFLEPLRPVKTEAA